MVDCKPMLEQNIVKCVCREFFFFENARINLGVSLNIGDYYPRTYENDGTCFDGMNNYTCACVPGFEGKNCSIECFHMTSRRPYWCPKTMKRRPCWCPKPILWELNSLLMQTLSFVPINLHRCWSRECKRSIGRLLNSLIEYSLNSTVNGNIFK